MRFRLLMAIIVVLFNSSCEKEININIPPSNYELVVHGFIESGEVARVDLTYELPIVARIDSSTIMDMIELNALVYVSDGVVKEQLTLVRNDSRFPPVFYQGRRLKGEIGKNYTLEIEIDSSIIVAETSIPTISYLDTIFYDKIDTSGQIVFRMKGNSEKDKYYRLLTKESGTKMDYIPSLNYGVFTDRVLNVDTINHIVYQGVSQFQTPFKDVYFASNDSFDIKLCAMDSVSFNIWKIIHGEILNYGNPLHISNTPYQSNIVGAKGVWTGYGVSRYRIYTW